MAYNGAGSFSRPVSDYVSGTVINQDSVNSEFDGISTGLSTAICKDGQTTITATIPMNSNKLSGLTTGSAAGDSVNLGQTQGEAFIWCGTAGGSQNAITLSPTPAITSYVAGQRFIWKSGSSANNSSMTINVSSVGTKNAYNNGAALTSAGEHEANKYFMAFYDGTQFQLMKFKILGDFIGSVVADTSPQLGGDLDLNSNNIDFPTTGNISDCVDEDNMASNSATKLCTQQSIKAYVDAHGLVQRAYAEDGAVATGTTVMPMDDTIPQKTEGDEYMTLAITPISATNRLRIRFTGTFTNAGSASYNSIALFQDTTAGALAAKVFGSLGNAAPNTYVLEYEMAAGTTSATTFKIRVGPSGSDTITFNGTGGARKLGGVLLSTMVIEEIKP